MRTEVVDPRVGAMPISATRIADIPDPDPIQPTPQLTWQAWTLAVTQAFTFYQAMSGGYALIEDRLPLPDRWLAQTPFDSWAVFGWLMIAVIALPQLVSALITVLAPRRVRPAILVGMATGASLVGWVIMQIVVMHAFFYLQPIVVGVGLGQIALAVSWRRSLAAEGDAAP